MQSAVGKCATLKISVWLGVFMLQNLETALAGEVRLVQFPDSGAEGALARHASPPMDVRVLTVGR